MWIYFRGDQSEREVLKDVGTYLNDELARKPPHIKIGLPLKRQAWEVYPGDLVSDGEWHPIKYDNLRDWVKARRNELDAGKELRGHVFIFRRNQSTGHYEIRLSGKYNLFRYSAP